MMYYHYEELKAFLSVKETANILGVSVSTVYRMIASGDLKAVKVSRCSYRIRASDLILFPQLNLSKIKRHRK